MTLGSGIMVTLIIRLAAGLAVARPPIAPHARRFD
jgi:hypothetical protein